MHGFAEINVCSPVVARLGVIIRAHATQFNEDTPFPTVRSAQCKYSTISNLKRLICKIHLELTLFRIVSEPNNQVIDQTVFYKTMMPSMPSTPSSPSAPANDQRCIAPISALDDQLVVAQAALDAVADAVVVVDTASWRITQANAQAQALFQLEGFCVMRMHFDLIRMRLRCADGNVPTPTALERITRHGSELRYTREHQDILPLELRTTTVRLADGEVLILVFRDLSERVQAASELRAASSRCGITFSQAATGLAHVTLDGNWSKVNHRLLAITGYDEVELLKMSVAEVTHPEDMPNETIAYQQLLLGELPYYTREKRYVRKNGMPIWVSVTTSLVRNGASRPLYFIGMVEDISKRKHAEERVYYLASHDVMTGLPNRHGLQVHLKKTLDAARASGHHVGVVFVDMDKLKQINDTLGHEQGDFALKQFARQLQQHLRGGDFVARIGGDEFVIVLANVTARSDISAILQRTLLSLAAAPAFEQQASAPSCSIGISVFPSDGGDARSLIRNADQAMYRAKQDGGARFTFFSDVPDFGTPSNSRLNLEGKS